MRTATNPKKGVQIRNKAISTNVFIIVAKLQFDIVKRGGIDEGSKT